MAHSVKLAPCQIDYLNLVRALAAQIVLVGHSTAYFLAGHDRGGRWETFGVLVFFLLSGFLIASSVQQKRDRADYRFGHYLIDRFCRIFAGYLPALVLVAVVDGLMRDLPAYPYAASSSPLQWLGNLVMLQEYPVFQILRRLGAPEQSWFIEAFGSGRPFWTGRSNGGSISPSAISPFSWPGKNASAGGTSSSSPRSASCRSTTPWAASANA